MERREGLVQIFREVYLFVIGGCNRLSVRLPIHEVEGTMVPTILRTDIFLEAGAGGASNKFLFEVRC